MTQHNQRIFLFAKSDHVHRERRLAGRAGNEHAGTSGQTVRAGSGLNAGRYARADELVKRSSRRCSLVKNRQRRLSPEVARLVHGQTIFAISASGIDDDLLCGSKHSPMIDTRQLQLLQQQHSPLSIHCLQSGNQFVGICRHFMHINWIINPIIEMLNHDR